MKDIRNNIKSGQTSAIKNHHILIEDRKMKNLCYGFLMFKQFIDGMTRIWGYGFIVYRQTQLYNKK